MARPVTYSTARRFVMQGIMWIILGATVGLAALVSYHRKSSLEVKLAPAIMYRQVTAQLPKGWEITKTSDPLSEVLLTATEGKRDEEDEDGPRVVRIVREPIAAGRQTAIEFAISRLGPGSRNARTISGKDYIAINHSPGEVLYQIRQSQPKSLRDLMTGGMSETKAICAASIGTSGRGVAVELEGEGRPEAVDIDLVKRIAATIKVSDEPALVDSGEVTLNNGAHVAIPTDFSAVKVDDELITFRTLRSKETTSPGRSIVLLPTTVLPKDGGPTVLTMLALYDANFNDATVQQEDPGVWRIDVDATIRAVLPTRAYATSKNGAGVIAVFHGGDDDSWIDEQWKGLREKLTFPEESNVSELTANGTDAAKRLMQDGLAKFLPESTDDLWWLWCLNTSDRAMGWRKFTHATNSGREDLRVQLEHILNETNYDWRGPMDLKTYKVNINFEVSDNRETEASRRDQRGFVATLKAGKIDLVPNGIAKPVSYTTPPNYVPGAWLPRIVGKLVDRPMIVRTESLADYAAVQPRDLLTVTLRPEPDAVRSTDDTNTPMHCISMEVSGSGEKSRWFYRADGTLDGVDFQQSQHLIRSDEHDVTMAFSHNEAMRP